LNGYDYAAQDPINNEDLTGATCKRFGSFIGTLQWILIPTICAVSAQGSNDPGATLPDVQATTNSRGELTSGSYTILESRQELHKNGTPGKSQFAWPDKADELVLAVAAYADAHHLWKNNRVTPTLQVDIGVSGGRATNRVTVSRRNNGFVHGWASS
jgi:hypothetical protein